MDVLAPGIPVGGGEVGGGPCIPVPGWLGNGELMTEAVGFGVLRRGVGTRANPSGKSFQAGTFDGAAYVPVAGDCAEGR